MADGIFLLFLTALLILLNGLFVAAEFAVVKVRTTRIEELVAQGSRLASVARTILRTLDSHLAACQVGITVASLALGAIAEPALDRLLQPMISALGITSEGARHAIAWAVSIGAVSFIHVVVGEQAPKAAAIAYAERTTLLLAIPLRISHFLLFPAVWVTNRASNALLSLLGLKHVSESETAHSPEELEKIIEASAKAGLLNDQERLLLEHAINLSERRVREIMVPRPDIVVLDATRSLEQNLAIVREQQHTRYPLTSEDRDKVLGMVHVKDLMDAQLRGERDLNLTKVVRPVIFVPEVAPLDRVLRTFQRSRTHLAIVVDEYGGVAGLVTLEDVLEELVGEIRDEFDVDEKDPGVVRAGAETLADAALPLDEAAKTFQFEPTTAAVETVGGYVLHLLGRLPKVGESVVVGKWRVEVAEMDGLRLTRLRWKPLDERRGAAPGPGTGSGPIPLGQSGAGAPAPAAGAGGAAAVGAGGATPAAGAAGAAAGPGAGEAAAVGGAASGPGASRA
jgi:CBS domain containing-hemolysin-like protein